MSLDVLDAKTGKTVVSLQGVSIYIYITIKTLFSKAVPTYRCKNHICFSNFFLSQLFSIFFLIC